MPFHIQEVTGPPACCSQCWAGHTRVWRRRCLVSGTWKVLEFLWKWNAHCQGAWTVRSWHLLGHEGHELYLNNYDRHTALGGQGSCSTSAACWLCKHRWSQPSWARYPPCLSHRIRMKYRSICCGNWLLHHVLLLLLFGAHLSRKVRRWISLCDNFQSL